MIFFCLRFLFFSITQTQKLSESACRRTRKEILFFLRLNKKRRENIFSQHTATQYSIVRLIVRKVNKFTELYSLFFSSTGNTPGSLGSINLVHCRGSLRREIIVIWSCSALAARDTVGAGTALWIFCRRGGGAVGRNNPNISSALGEHCADGETSKGMYPGLPYFVRNSLPLVSTSNPSAFSSGRRSFMPC